jgi:hypothetical protein
VTKNAPERVEVIDRKR